MFQINHRVCSLVDAIRPFRADTSAQQAQLRTTQRTYQMERQDDDSIQARALITVSPSDAGGEIALLGVDTSGRLNAVFASRAQLAALIANPRSAGSIAGVGPNAWRFTIYDNDAPGPRGILLITSCTPVDVPLLTTSVGSRSRAWTRRVADAAQAGGWRSEMVWYTTERSSIPPTPPMPAGAAPPTPTATAQHPAPPERPGRR